MKNYISLILFFSSSIALAAKFEPSTPAPGWQPTQHIELKINKGSLVEVLSYDQDTDTYNLRILSGMDIGPNLITLKELKRVTNLNLLKGEKPKKLIGKRTVLKSKARLVTGFELNQRRKEVERNKPMTPDYHDARIVGSMTKIKIGYYDPASEVFHVYVNGKESPKHDNYATLTALRRAVPKLARMKTLDFQPKRLVGKMVHLVRKLKLVSQAEVDQREKVIAERLENNSNRVTASVAKPSVPAQQR